MAPRSCHLIIINTASLDKGDSCSKVKTGRKHHYLSTVEKKAKDEKRQAAYLDKIWYRFSIKMGKQPVRDTWQSKSMAKMISHS